MRFTTTYSRGEIVLVPFAFSGRQVFKNRPALVISSTAYNSTRMDLIIAALTGRVRQPLLTGEYQISDWQACGLPRPSVVTMILRTTKQSLVVRKLGDLPAGELTAFEQRLRSVLAL
jgi:mRNA interferase MazF